MQTIRSNRRALAGLMGGAVIVGFAGCTAPARIVLPQSSAPSAAEISFDRLEQRYFNEMLALTPVAATALGEHRFDALLDDVSPGGFAHRAALAAQLSAQLTAIDANHLSRAHQVDLQLLRAELEKQQWEINQLQRWRWDPLLYTALTGNSVYTLMARDFAPLQARLLSVTARLSELTRLLAQVRQSLDPARVPPIHAHTAIEQNNGVLQLITQLVAPEVNALPAEQQAPLKNAIAHARAAIAQHQIWLEKKLLPAAQGEFRLGAALYDSELRYELGSSLSRAEIRELADVQLRRTRGRMYDLAAQVLRSTAATWSLPATPDPEQQQAAIAAALELAYQRQPARTEVLETVRRALTDAESFVRAHELVTVYDDPLEVIVTPEFQRGVSLAFCDTPGPLDRGQRTYLAVAPIPPDWTQAQVQSYLREYNTRSIYELTLHEAMPGHYLQLMHANRYPSPLRAVLASHPFIEGWAVYAEGVMADAGFQDNDPLMRLIHLKWDLRTIANAILDQGVHAEGMSRDEAMRLMTHDTFQQESEAAAKWVRAQLTAAQLSTYFVGWQEHRALREEVEQRWGKAFTLKRYHDALLAHGSAPVGYVRELLLDLPITPMTSITPADKLTPREQESP